MKTLNIPLEDKDYKLMYKAKKINNCKTWRDYLLLPVEKTLEQS